MDWPDVGHVLHELDFDRDGTVDFSEVVEGREAPAPLAPGLEADLSIQKSVAPETLALGETATYIVEVENLGPEDAHEVALVDVISGAPYVELVDTTHGSCSPQPAGISCELGALDVGEVATIVYTAAPSLPGSMANGASVFGVEGDGHPDLVSHYRTALTAIAHGDTRACISASTLGGRALAGCDSLRTVPRKGRKGR